MASEPVRIRNYLDAADTSSTLAAVARAGRDRRAARRRAGRSAAAGCATRLPPAGRDRRRQRGHADAAAAGLACVPAGRRLRRSTATSRSGAARSTGSPSRWRRWARGSRRARAASRRSRCTARSSPASSTSCRSPARRSSRACCSPGWSTDATTVVEPVPTRDHTERMLMRAGATVQREPATGGGVRTTIGNVDELEIAEIDVPGDPSSAAFLIAAGVLVPGSRPAARGGRDQLDAVRVLADPRADAGDRARRHRAGRRVRRRGAGRRPRRPGRGAGGHDGRAPRRCRWRSTSCRWWRCWAALPRARPWSAARASCA